MIRHLLGLAAALALAGTASAQVISNGGVASGPVASGASNAGNPVKSGCVYNATLPSLSSGQIVDEQCDLNGNVRVNLVVSNFNNAFTGNTNFMGFIGGGNVSAGQNLLATANFINDGSQRDVPVGILGAVANGNAGTGVTATEEAGRTFTHISTATSTVVKASKGFLHTVNIGTCVSAATVSLYDNASSATTPISVITCPAATSGFSMTYDVAFSNGLYVVTSGATDVTVAYR